MNSRERVRAAINHQKPDRIPIDLGSTRTSGISVFSYQELKRYLKLGDDRSRVVDVYQMLADVEPEILERLHGDVLMVPKRSHRLNTTLDGWSDAELFNGETVLMPNGFAPRVDGNGDWVIEEPDGSRARLPRGGYYFDYEEESIPPAPEDVDTIDFGFWSDEDFRFCEAQSHRLFDATDKALVGDFGVSLGKPGPYVDWLYRLAGEPAYIREFNDRKSLHIVELLEAYRQAVGERIQIVFFGQDFGTQNGEMIGPEMFDDLFAPYFTRIFAWIHENTEWKVFFHCCGSIFRLIPLFIECGVDILNPVQCSAARMDPATLKRTYGDDIVFWGGGIDTQDVLPFGTEAEIRQQVRERIELLGPSGFVFNPVHNVQAGIAPENIVACFDAAYEYGG